MENADEALRDTYLAAMELGRAHNLPTLAFALLSAGASRGKGRTAGGVYLARTLNEVLAIAIEAIQEGAYEGLQEVRRGGARAPGGMSLSPLNTPPPPPVTSLPNPGTPRGVPGAGGQGFG